MATNSNPKVIARFYLETVEECILLSMFQGFPYVVRMDCGTENVSVAAIQYALRAKNEGEGNSPANVVCLIVLGK